MRIECDVADAIGPACGPSAAWVYMVLTRHVTNGTNTCFPSLNTIAREAGCAKNTVIKSLEKLIAKGFVSKESRGRFGHEWDSNIYTLIHLIPLSTPSATPSAEGSAVGSSQGSAEGGSQIEPELEANYSELNQLEKTISIPGGLERVWSVYPKDRRPGNATPLVGIWNKIHPRGDEVGKMIRSIEAWKLSDKWKEANGQYIPGLKKFLEERRWEIDPPADPYAGMTPDQRMLREMGLQ